MFDLTSTKALQHELSEDSYSLEQAGKPGCNNLKGWVVRHLLVMEGVVCFALG